MNDGAGVLEAEVVHGGGAAEDQGGRAGEAPCAVAPYRDGATGVDRPSRGETEVGTELRIGGVRACVREMRPGLQRRLWTEEGQRPIQDWICQLRRTNYITDHRACMFMRPEGVGKEKIAGATSYQMKREWV